MHSKYFHYYQIIAWLAVYTVIVGTIHLSRGVSQYEWYFAAALIGTTALYSYFIRFVFVRHLKDRAIFLQIIYLLLQSIIGAAIGALTMVVCILAFSYFKFIPTIPSDSIAFAVNTMFWGNWYNMFSALVFWSSIYLLMVKMRQLYATKEALASSQLDVLSQQLNPHFLFNTLNNIRASILEDPNKARDALAQLSDMLRYTLVKHKQAKVVLSEELTVVEEFIALCKIQYENRLQFHTQIDSSAASVLIPRMLLQLCVENAIKHGISKLKDGGEVRLHVAVNALDYVDIKISNPVPKARIPVQDDQLNAGVGLKNIKQRMALLYGERPVVKPSLNFSITNNIATVVIVLPLEYAQPPFSTTEIDKETA
ncbi:MAG: histidine kinase [Glaciecola sp.]